MADATLRERVEAAVYTLERQGIEPTYLVVGDRAYREMLGVRTGELQLQDFAWTYMGWPILFCTLLTEDEIQAAGTSRRTFLRSVSG